jgi:hypothetical protein
MVTYRGFPVRLEEAEIEHIDMHGIELWIGRRTAAVI